MDDATRVSRADRSALYVTVAIGAAAAGGALWATVSRLMEVLPGRDIPVVVPLDERASLPLGPDGAEVEAAVEHATVIVPTVAPATHFALVAHPLVTGLALVAGIVLFSLFCLNLARGKGFARSNVRIVVAAMLVLTVGWALATLFQTMSVNGALASLSDGTYDTLTAEVDLTWVFALLALGAVAGAFQIGERLQRDTRGLV